MDNYVKIFNVCTETRKKAIREHRIKGKLKNLLYFVGGFSLGQLYYTYFLKDIPFPSYIGNVLSLAISIVLGIGNALSIQLRCMSLLLLPIYCGKPGRGVLKAVALTYVVAGPITNMGFNAREVVRVFACVTQLSHNVSETKYNLMARPIKGGILASTTEINQLKEILSSIKEVVTPIENEIEGCEELRHLSKKIQIIANHFDNTSWIHDIEKQYQSRLYNKNNLYQNKYLRKIEYRCVHMIARGMLKCMELYKSALASCKKALPSHEQILCRSLNFNYVCNIRKTLRAPDICDAGQQIDVGLGEGYACFKRIKYELTNNTRNVKLQYKVIQEAELYDIQDAKETGSRVMHAFQERGIVMQYVVVIVNICLALLSFRIVVAAHIYHDLYLTRIKFDNVYITSYFKRIDQRRRVKNKYTLLPLNKMERYKYKDVHSFSFKSWEHSKLLTHILKVMLEVVTATTFVMLDRLFYEALDVVRQHAVNERTPQGIQDLEIEVEGNGPIAGVIRNVLNGFNSTRRVHHGVTNEACVPHPRAMPVAFFVKIYGAYLWILLLLCCNPYTLPLRRKICSYFYPHREKKRILHLYNDILKKRMKMQKTLRRKAIQAVRTHYLSAENMLTLRMRYPRILGWLAILPAARMTCLICSETEPRSYQTFASSWHSCTSPACPFVYCHECWLQTGACCVACDPALADLSDIDSLSDDDPPHY